MFFLIVLCVHILLLHLHNVFLALLNLLLLFIGNLSPLFIESMSLVFIGNSTILDLLLNLLFIGTFWNVIPLGTSILSLQSNHFLSLDFLLLLSLVVSSGFIVTQLSYSLLSLSIFLLHGNVHFFILIVIQWVHYFLLLILFLRCTVFVQAAYVGVVVFRHKVKLLSCSWQSLDLSSDGCRECGHETEWEWKWDMARDEGYHDRMKHEWRWGYIIKTMNQGYIIRG